MAKILYLGADDALFRSRRMLLERAGFDLSPISDPEIASSDRAWKKFEITLLSITIPKVARKKLQEQIKKDGCSVIDLEQAFRAHGQQGLSDLGPETFLGIVGDAVRAVHRHPEVKGKNVAWVDGQRRYVHVTDGFLEIIGFERAEVLGCKIDDFTYPGTADAEDQFINYRKDGRQTGQYYLRHKSGKKIVVEFEAGVLEDGCMYSKIKRAKPAQ